VKVDGLGCVRGLALLPWLGLVLILGVWCLSTAVPDAQMGLLLAIPALFALALLVAGFITTIVLLCCGERTWGAAKSCGLGTVLGTAVYVWLAMH
jgi:hypothetical protein